MNSKHILGYSEQGRPIEIVIHGSDTASVRILVMAGQHGDEPLACKAVNTFSELLEHEGVEHLDVQVALILNANPDGAAVGKRCNASGIDLNRDHQLLKSKEVQVIHQFVHTWRPALVIDVHTYPPRRNHLLEQGLVYCQDVFLDTANNLSLLSCQTNKMLNRCILPTIHELQQQGIRADRYTLIRKSGRIRHSTKDIVDARNGLALRYGCRTVLIEGRHVSSKKAPQDARHVVFAMTQALHHIVAWTGKNRDMFVNKPSKRPFIIVDSRYKKADGPYQMQFEHVEQKAIKTVELQGTYTPTLVPRRQIVLPSAYAVPVTCTEINEVLKRQGIKSNKRPLTSTMHIEKYRIDEVVPSIRPNRTPRKLALTPHRKLTFVYGYEIYPVSEKTATALAAWLEPHSEFSLHRYPEMEISLQKGRNFPILKVL